MVPRLGRNFGLDEKSTGQETPLRRVLMLLVSDTFVSRRPVNHPAEVADATVNFGDASTYPLLVCTYICIVGRHTPRFSTLPWYRVLHPCGSAQGGTRSRARTVLARNESSRVVALEYRLL